MKINFTLNGAAVSTDIEPQLLLSELLREKLFLTGTHVGCDTSQCGACVVHLDGRSIKSCSILAVQVDGRAVTSIEGLANDETLHPLQIAFAENHALQCGFCTPGMIMSLAELLEKKDAPTERELRIWLEGNLCRCTGYHNIILAALAAASSNDVTAP